MAKIEVFSGPLCGYCERAKSLLNNKGAAFDEFDVSKDENRDEFMRRLPRARSIPQIFIDGEHTGGCEDLELLEKNGRLDELLSV